MQNDVLDDDNGIVNYQPHGCGQSAQGHQIKTFTEYFQNNECDKNRDWDHQAGNY